MRILIIHEIDWLKKITYEPHHFAELFSLQGHEVFAIDCRQPNIQNVNEGLHTIVIKNLNRIYQGASITLIHPPSLLIKGFNRMTNFLTCENVIRETITEQKIDIILLYGVATNGIQTIKIAQEKNIPVVFRVLDVAHGLVNIPILQQLVKKYEKIVLCNATKVLAPTKDLINYAIEMGAKKDNVEFFPLGVNLRDFKPMKRDNELTQELGISEKDKVVVFIGTIYDFAGLDRIALKFHIIKNKIPNLKFVIVGGGPYFTKLQSIINKKNLKSDIILTGYQPQPKVPRYISLADICVNPFKTNYVTERILPIKILEYLACGKPVLSTPLRGTRQLLPNEDFGITFSTSEKFIETLADLILDEEKLNELGKKGFSYVKENHDWSTLTHKITEKFENLIRNST